MPGERDEPVDVVEPVEPDEQAETVEAAEPAVSGDSIEADVLAQAREALRRAAEARGLDPDEVQELPPVRRRDDDPFAAAREALEKAERVRSELGESPRQREARLRAMEQLELLKSGRVGAAPAPSGASEEAPDAAAPAARKRRL